MSENETMLVEPFRGLLGSICTPQDVRAAEKAGSVHPMWRELKGSGFLDALVPESGGGAGLNYDDVFALVAACGDFALPVPFAETMVARGLLAQAGESAPDDAIIVLAPPSAIVPFAAVATHALQQDDDRLILSEIKARGDDPFAVLGAASVTTGAEIASASPDGLDLLATAASLTAASMAGSMVAMQQMAISYVGDRHQFGRPLGKFQAIQQQLAVMAEQVASAYLAARIGLSGERVDPLRAAMAKCRVSEAAHQVSAIAHAVHGAIGATEEYDLQLFSRRIKQGQMAFGSESYWAAKLAEDRLTCPELNSADFLRLKLQE